MKNISKSIKNILMLFISVMMTLTSVMPIKAQSINSSHHVDEMNVSETEINDHQVFEIEWKFSGKKDKPIKSNQVIKLELNDPRNENVDFHVYTDENSERNVPVYIKKYHVGDLIIEPKEIILRFNKNIERMEVKNNQTGVISLKVRATLKNVQPGEAERVQIKSGEHTHDLIINKPQPGTQAAFLSKSGYFDDADLTTISWMIDIYANSQEVIKNLDHSSFIKFTDTIQEGHELAPESFMIDVLQGNTNSWEYISLEEFHNRFPKSRIEVIDGIIKGEIAASELMTSDHGTALRIFYDTKVKNSKQATYKNTVSFEHQEYKSESPVVTVREVEVKNLLISIMVEGQGDQGELKIRNLVVGDDTPVEGMELSITNIDTNKTFTAITNKDGEAVWKNIPDGKYVVKEVSTPDYIVSYKEEYQITYRDSEGFLLIKRNDVKHGQLMVEKKWDGQNLENAKFEIQGFINSDGEELDIISTENFELKASDYESPYIWTKELEIPLYTSKGEPIKYTIEEVSKDNRINVFNVIVEGVKVDDNREIIDFNADDIATVKVISKYEPKYIDLNINNKWEGKALEKIQLKLVAESVEGIITEDVVLNKDNNYQKVLQKPVFTPTGEEINYSLKVNMPSEVDQQYDVVFLNPIEDNEKIDLTVISTYKPRSVDLTIKNEWNGQPLNQIKLTLQQYLGEKLIYEEAIVLSADSNWTESRQVVYETKDGETYLYKVVAPTQDGYELEVINDSENKFIIVYNELIDNPVDQETEEPETPVDQETEDPETPVDQETEEPEAPVDQETEDPEIPVDQETEDPETPVNQETEEPEAPVDQETEDRETPVEQETEDPEIPVNQETEDRETPVDQETEEPEIPIAQGTEDEENPKVPQRPDAEEPKVSESSNIKDNNEEGKALASSVAIPDTAARHTYFVNFVVLLASLLVLKRKKYEH